MAASTRRAEPDFTQGFGSFNFLPSKDCICSISDETSDDLSDISENQKTSTEPQRSNPQEFNFLSLPLEIRRKVYKCFTEELWEDCMMNDDRVRFCAADRAWCHKRPHENLAYDVAMSSSSDHPDSTVDYEPPSDLDFSFENRMPTEDEASETTSVLSSDDSDVDTDDLPPPMPQVNIVVNRDFRERRGSYCKHNNCIDPSKICRPHPPFYCPCIHAPPAPFLDIISLSQVSRQITRELGECLWESATVKFEDPGTFLMFARERPAALPFIRGIVLGLDCSPESPNLNTDTTELEAMLSFVSENMDLRFFDVELRVLLFRDGSIGPESPLPDLMGATAVAWTPLFRALRRADAFDVRVLELGELSSTMPPHKNPNPWINGRRALLPQPLADLARTVLGLWMPDCLREKEAGEEASYLRSRLASG